MYVGWEKEKRYKWLIESDAEGMEAGWGCFDFVMVGILFLFYIAPAVLYAGAKWYFQNSFNKRMEESHKKAFEITQCRYLAQFLHQGGHPNLGYRNWVLVGLKNSKIYFYNLFLEELHSIPVSSVKISTDTRHASATSFGNTYVPRNSNYGVTTSTTSVNMHPDTIIIHFVMDGNQIDATFHVHPYDPLEFVQTINEIRTNAIKATNEPSTKPRSVVTASLQEEAQLLQDPFASANYYCSKCNCDGLSHDAVTCPRCYRRFV